MSARPQRSRRKDDDEAQLRRDHLRREVVDIARTAVATLTALLHETGTVPPGIWRDPYALGFVYCLIGGLALHAGAEEEELADLMRDSFLALAAETNEGEDGLDLLNRAIELIVAEDDDFLDGLHAGDKVTALALGYEDYDDDDDVIEARRRAADVTHLMSDWQQPGEGEIMSDDEAAILYLQQRLFCAELRRRLPAQRIH